MVLFENNYLSHSQWNNMQLKNTRVFLHLQKVIPKVYFKLKRQETQLLYNSCIFYKKEEII